VDTHIYSLRGSKFTKWVETKPLVKLDGATATKFVKDIVVRYGIPHSIITDNASNLSQGKLKNTVERWVSA
jgi:hypothetical protein